MAAQGYNVVHFDRESLESVPKSNDSSKHAKIEYNERVLVARANGTLSDEISLSGSLKNINRNYNLIGNNFDKEGNLAYSNNVLLPEIDLT